MPNVEIDLNPVDFITVGTVGPKGKRQFYLQAGQGQQVVSLIVEKEQTRRLGEAIAELLDDLNKQRGEELPPDNADVSQINMDLHDPIDALFRVDFERGLGLGYDEEHDLIVLVAQELIVPLEGQDPETIQPSVARFWASRVQMRALSLQAAHIVKQGRVDPKSNGRILYYWT